MHVAGMKRQDMLAHVMKKDGSKLVLNTLDEVIAKRTEDPDWRGAEVHVAGGRPRELTPKEEKSVVDLENRPRQQRFPIGRSALCTV